MLFLFCCRDGAGKIKKCIYGVGRVHRTSSGSAWRTGRGSERERGREIERADGNGNAVSGEMRKGGRKRYREGERAAERASEAIRYMPPPPPSLPLLQLPGKNVRLPVLRFLLLLSHPHPSSESRLPSFPNLAIPEGAGTPDPGFPQCEGPIAM